MLEFIASWNWGLMGVICAFITATIAVGSTLIAIGMWIRGVNGGVKSVDELRLDFKEMQGDFRTMQSDIKTLDNKVTDLLFKHSPSGPSGPSGQDGRAQALSSKSPIQLTKFGNEISKTLDFQATAKELAPKLRQRAAGKLKYDIQTLSFDFIRREYQPSREVEVRMKTYSYDEGVAMEIILDVLAVELRNQLL